MRARPIDYDDFLDDLLSRTREAFRETPEYMIAEEKCDAAKRECVESYSYSYGEAGMAPAEKWERTRSDANYDEMAFTYCRAFRDCVALLRHIGAL